MKIKSIIPLSILLIYLILGNFAFAKPGIFKSGSEPDGFRGIKWGTDFSTVEKEMEYIRIHPLGGSETKVYLRKEDELYIGEAELKKIEYHFWKGKFCMVNILTKELSNWYSLKEVIFEKFGPGYKGDELTYAWFGETTGVTLTYNGIFKEGVLLLRSEKIFDQIETVKKQKAKEGAKKGF